LLSVFGFSQRYDNIFIRQTLSEDIISRFKSTQTIFFVNEKAPGVEQLKTAVKDAWTLTPLLFDDVKNVHKYSADSKYSYFLIEGERLVSQKGVVVTTFYITLRLFEKIGKKDKIVTKALATIELYPNFETMKIPINRDIYENAPAFYREGYFYNWSPMLISGNLQAVENNLKSGFRGGTYDGTKTDDLGDLGLKLSKDTLYVPKKVLMDFNAFNGKEKVKEENVFENYKYKYRICSDEEIYDIFQAQKRGRLLFEYVKSSSQKIITIFDIKDRKVIYKKSESSYNLKAKDIEKLNKY
jgi:hypothetical protein